MKIVKGSKRIVIIGKKRAWKFPNIFSWRGLLQGLLMNASEGAFAKLDHPLLVPVYFCAPGGFLNIQPAVIVAETKSPVARWETLMRHDHSRKMLSNIVEFEQKNIGLLQSESTPRAISYGRIDMATV